MKPDSSQEKAIQNISSSAYKITALVGRAGYGKSFTVKHIVNKLVDDMSFDSSSIFFCAPTGKAAKVLQDELAENSAAENEAVTIHRLFGCRGVEWEFNSKNRLPAKFLIVDESSMVDSQLMARIIRSVPHDCKILLVGDPSQLFPVSSGCPFLDIVLNKIDTPQVNELQVCHRQKAGSLIADAAERCRNGHKILYGTPGGKTLPGGMNDDLFLHSHDEGNSDILKNVAELAEPFFKQNSDYVILSPQHNGVVGIKSANLFLQEELNGGSHGFSVGDNKLMVGDRVRQTKNDYELGVFNGFVGTIIDIEGKTLFADFDGNVVEYKTMKQIFNLTLGYVVSIHASQGSGYDHGIIIADRSHTFMWNRQLVYVALSRFKKSCQIVGQKSTISRAINKNVESSRNTLVGDSLKDRG